MKHATLRGFLASMLLLAGASPCRASGPIFAARMDFETLQTPNAVANDLTANVSVLLNLGVAPPCPDLDGDAHGNPASPECAYPGLDCLDDPSQDDPICDNCTCGNADCAACARCIHPGAHEFPGDNVDSDCNGQNENCFIATASFGTAMAGKIEALRDFRDSRLLVSSSGRTFVEAYYRLSPSVAEHIAARGWLRAAVRALLLPLVGVALLLG